jgi:diaminopropionate ammonia-lyase
VISDTSYEGYLKIPRNVMAGYTTLATEVLDQTDKPITHVFVQAGVGGLAAALVARLWMEAPKPHVVIIESEHAACLLRSARRGAPASVKVRNETVMAGLSCGEVSIVAWEILRRAAADFVTISDSAVAPAMRMLASGVAGGGKIEAGECSVPGPVALIAACCDLKLREAMKLDAESRVLVIGSEGATDPEIYGKILAAG